MKLTVKSLAKKIEQDNEMFDKATRAEKRVIVAQDCLDRIKLGQIIPYSGRFCDIEYSAFDSQKVNVKEILDHKNMPICKSCAKGSLFMSYIGRVNNFKVDNIHSNNDVDGEEHLKMREIFTLRQLSLIERVFEDIQHISYNEKSGYINLSHYSSKIQSFREKYIGKSKYWQGHAEDKKLLIAICNNIIQNKGTFKL